MATLNKYNNKVMSEVVSPVTGKSDAQVYNDSMDVVAKATALLNKSKQNTDTTTDTGTGFKYDYSSNQDEDAIINRLQNEAGITSTSKVDEDKIRRDTLKLFRKEIDATNNIYNDIVNRQEVVNLDNEGGLRAIQNRQGLVGSMRGFSQTQGQRDQGMQAIGAINAERATKISTIQGLARKEALDEITAKRKAQQEGASSYLSYVELQDERKAKRVSNVLSALVSQGIDPNEMMPAELEEIAKNLGVGVQDIVSGYSDATAESRAKEQASTRENSIVALIKDGVTDPKDLLDYLNYNEAGEKVGDITLAEIKAVQDALKVDDKGFNLSEGQSRYVLQADGTYKEIASKGKTYKPTDSGKADYYTPSFTEWASTVTRDSQIDKAGQAKQEELGRALTPDESWGVLRNKYKELYGENAPIKTAEEYTQEVNAIKAGGGATNIPDLNNLTPTNKRDIQNAGLNDASAQMYLISTEPAFRQFYLKGIATGEIPRGASVDKIDSLYEGWYAEKEASDNALDDMSAVEMLQMLNSEQ